MKVILPFGVNGAFGAPERILSNNFSKTKSKFCLSLHYNGYDIYLFVNRKKPISLKQITEMPTFHSNFVLEPYIINLTMLI